MAYLVKNQKVSFNLENIYTIPIQNIRLYIVYSKNNISLSTVVPQTLINTIKHLKKNQKMALRIL